MSLPLHMSVWHVQTCTFTHEYTYTIHTLYTLIKIHTERNIYTYMQKKILFFPTPKFWFLISLFLTIKEFDDLSPSVHFKHQRVGGKSRFVPLWTNDLSSIKCNQLSFHHSIQLLLSEGLWLFNLWIMILQIPLYSQHLELSTGIMLVWNWER